MSERRGIVIGTAGHVDHGKTSLVRALTGVETDRWREERERGLTIDIGFAPLALDDSHEVGMVDVPGHEDFLKNMLAGATGIDVLLLVVAADEGPMPQTREHLAIAEMLNVRLGVVALTKTDNVDEEWLELAQDTTRELLDATPGRKTWPIVPVSAKTGEGMEELRAVLRESLTRVDARRGDDVFRLPVDRVFSIHGTGTVVTGTVWSGAVEVGETLRVFPGESSVRIRGLQVHDETRSKVTAGRRCAFALVGVSPSDVARGSVLVSDPAWRESHRLGVRLSSLGASARSIEHGQRVRVYLGTREVMARVLTPRRTDHAPGEVGWAVLDLEAPLVARAKDRAILRFYSPVHTIGGIEVAEHDPPRFWDDRTPRWGEILDGSAADAFRAATELAGLSGLPADVVPLALGRPASEIDASAGEAGVRRIGSRWFSVAAGDDAVTAVEAAMSRLHLADRRAAAISKEAVRSALDGVCALELVELAIESLLARGVLVEDGPRLARADHAPELTKGELEAQSRLEAAIVDGGLQPPTVGDLAKTLGLARPVLDDLLRLLQEGGVTRAVTPEIHVSARALDDMTEQVRELLADQSAAPPTVFKTAFRLSRKYLIPLLEYLDREGVTRRTAEGRVLVG